MLWKPFRRSSIGPVFVFEQPPRHLHDVVGGNADEALVERSMVDRTQAETVPDCWFSSELHIANYVRSVE